MSRVGRLRLRATPVGDAVLIHPRERIDARAAGFAGGLARDPQHTLVVVDLPAGALAEEWPAVARVLSSSRYGGLRMVFGRDTGEDVRRAAGKIADRLGREVVAPDGAVLPTAGGGLFVPGDDAAWLRFRPGLAAETDSHRFPTPDWEFSLPGRARAVGRHTTAQPVASGVWLRHTDRGQARRTPPARGGDRPHRPAFGSWSSSAAPTRRPCLSTTWPATGKASCPTPGPRSGSICTARSTSPSPSLPASASRTLSTTR